MKPRVATSPTDLPADVPADVGPSAGIALEIHRRALRTPRAEAVVDGPVTLDCATLNAAAATVARELGRQGVIAGQAVAVALPRSWRLVCVMLGILRLGAQVVPLDTQSPAERRRFILRDCAAVALVREATESVTQPAQDVKALDADTLLPDLPDPADA
ncbi:AMP-binding protein, partial [Streptomyces ardesiacus]|uniref:AMP-binding protein n=1 Tax=Streptomyces ardesiacus TaxID=285564 RepID=UPI0036402DDE